ncbi:hypothetical protein [Nocardia sp. NPDC020380]|uniref:AraC-like ligand-binding domain-containing protein n=1 Tax=Nocardia sp. NPDC020380 TaxID=3364309 RepID=UPI0037894DA2
MQFESTEISYERTSADVEADGDRSARLLIPRRGTLGIEQHGTRVTLRPGQMGVVDWSRRMVLSHGDQVRGWILNVLVGTLRLSPDGPPYLALDTHDPLLGSVLALTEQLDRHSDRITATQFLKISTHWTGCSRAPWMNAGRRRIRDSPPSPETPACTSRDAPTTHGSRWKLSPKISASRGVNSNAPCASRAQPPTAT